MLTPNAVDQYSRLMVDMFDEKQVIKTSTAGQAFFGRPETGAKTVFAPSAEVVEIDIMRANEKLAAMITRGQNNGKTINLKNTNTQKFSSFSRVFPLIEEEGELSASQINKRVAGEGAYQGKSAVERIRILGVETHEEHIRRIIRTYEYLAWQSILTGKMDAMIGTSDSALQYDFKRLAAHSYTVSNLWTGGSQVIMQDIDGACDKVRADAHLNPDMMIVGATAMDAFLKDTNVKATADTRRFEYILVGMNNPAPAKYQRFIDAGLIAHGSLMTPSGYRLWVFTYVDGYTNSSGVFTTYMDKKKVLICSSDARCDRYFGPAEVLPATAAKKQLYMEYFGVNPDAPSVPMNVKNPSGIITPEMFNCDAYVSPDFKTVTLRTQSAPIFATTMTDAFVTMTVLS